MGKLLPRAHNLVLKTNDPTSHAKVTAIRKASKNLGRRDLSDCEIYISCMPCPMCLGAIYWARIKKVYYGCLDKDAEDIGFCDKLIYDVIKLESKDTISMNQIDRDECLKPFLEFYNKKDKLIY